VPRVDRLLLFRETVYANLPIDSSNHPGPIFPENGNHQGLSHYEGRAHLHYGQILNDTEHLFRHAPDVLRLLPSKPAPGIKVSPDLENPVRIRFAGNSRGNAFQRGVQLLPSRFPNPQGPEAAIKILTSLKNHPRLQGYYLLHATLAELYSRTEETSLARAHFTAAMGLTTSKAELAFLNEKLASVS
jgi:hypothetical protein